MPTLYTQYGTIEVPYVAGDTEGKRLYEEQQSQAISSGMVNVQETPEGNYVPSTSGVTTTSNNLVYDDQTGQMYDVSDPAHPVAVDTEPAYEVNPETGDMEYNPDNRAGLPDTGRTEAQTPDSTPTSPSTVKPPTSDQIAAGLGGWALPPAEQLQQSQERINPQWQLFELKQTSLNTDWNNFENTWSSFIQGDIFTGTEEEYNRYKAEYDRLSAKQDKLSSEYGTLKTRQDILDKDFNELYIKLPNDSYMLKSDYKDLSENYKKIADAEGAKALQSIMETDRKAFEAANTKLPDGKWISNTELQKIREESPNLYSVLREKGYDAYLQSVTVNYTDFKRRNTLLPDGQYISNNDLQKIKEESPELHTVLMTKGYDAYAEELKKQGSVGNIAKNMAISFIPVAGTIQYYNEAKKGGFTLGEKALLGLSIAGDILTFVPLVGAVAAGARATGTVARDMSTGARLAGAARGAANFGISEVRAPFTMVMHPLETAKASIQPFKLILPRRIPISTVEVSSLLVKFPVKEAGDVKEAIKLGDAAFDTAIKGESRYVKVGQAELKVEPVAASKLGEPIAIHATDDVTPFLNKSGIDINGKEGGLFVSSSNPEEFTIMSASGMNTIPIPPSEEFRGALQRLSKYTPDNMARVDVDPVRALNLADGKEIPKDFAPILQKYIKDNDGFISGSFVEWTKVKNALQPNDVDIIFKESAPHKEALVALMKKAGYEAKVSERGVVYLGKDKEWHTLANVISESGHKNMTNGLFTPKVGQRVDGIRMETLGSQTINQAQGSLKGDTKAVVRGTKVSKIDAPAVVKAAKQAKIPQKINGALIIRDQNIIKALRSSNKTFYDVREIEKLLPNGYHLPPPEQILYSYRPDGERIALLVIGKPFTKTEVAKLKLLGTAEDIKQIFTPAFRMKSGSQGNKLSNLYSQYSTLQKQANRYQKANNAAGLQRTRTQLNRVSRQINNIQGRRGLASSGRLSLAIARTSREGLFEGLGSPRTSQRGNVREKDYGSLDTPRLSNLRTSSTPPVRMKNRDSSNITLPRVSPRVPPPSRGRSGNTPVEPVPPRPPRPPSGHSESRPPRVNPPTVRPPRIPPPVKPLLILPNVEYKSGKDIKVSGGTVEWKQGRIMYHGKLQDVWHYKQYPYDKLETLIGDPLPATKNVNGKTPQDTIQLIGGAARKSFEQPLGIVTAHIKQGATDITFSRVISAGDIIWKEGKLRDNLWYILHSPYTKKTAFLGTPPHAKNPEGRTPQETIQIVGGRVKKNLDIPLGKVIAHIRANEEKITFTENKSQQVKISKHTSNKRVSSSQVRGVR